MVKVGMRLHLESKIGANGIIFAPPLTYPRKIGLSDSPVEAVETTSLTNGISALTENWYQLAVEAAWAKQMVFRNPCLVAL